MKNLIYSALIVLTASFGFSQNNGQNNETINNGRVIGSFELGSKEVTTIMDETTDCVRKTSPHTKGLFTPNENVEIILKEKKQSAEVRKPALPEKVYSNKKCESYDYGMELNDSQISEIANLHNQILQTIFNDYNESYQISNLISDMSSIHIDNLPNDIRMQVINNSSYDMNYLQNNLNDYLSLNYCKEIENSILNSSNINDLNGKLLALSNKIKADKRGFNKTVPLLFIETSKNSALFWTGSTGSDVIGDQDVQAISPWVKGLIAADGLGAAGAFTGYGLLAGVTGPVGWGGLVAMVGFSAAWSSATYALM